MDPETAYLLIRAKITERGVIVALGQLENTGSAIMVSLDWGKTWKVHEYTEAAFYDLELIEGMFWVVGGMDGKPVVLQASGLEPPKRIFGLNTNDQLFNCVDFISVNEGWLGGSDGLIRHTTDGGKSWTPCSTSEKFQYIDSLGFVDSQRGILATSKGEVRLTIDGGVHWTKTAGANLPDELTTVGADSSGFMWAMSGEGTVLYCCNTLDWHEYKTDRPRPIYAGAYTNSEIWQATISGDIYRCAVMP